MWTSGSWAAALRGEGPALLLGLAAWLPLRALGKRCGLLPCSFAACLSLWEDRRGALSLQHSGFKTHRTGVVCFFTDGLLIQKSRSKESKRVDF